MDGITTYNEKSYRSASFTSDLSNADFKMHQFTDFSGSRKELKKCDFSYSTFTRVYFRKVKFIECDFTGAKFFDSNLRDAEFENCKFHYASFKFTLIRSSQVLKNLPEWPNVKIYLLQIHKANANSIGDTKAARLYLLEEIEANKEHLRRAIKRNEGYYSVKYSGFKSKIVVYYKSISLKVDNFLWGHGESLWKMFRNVIAFVLIVSVYQTLSTIELGNTSLIQSLKLLFGYVRSDIKIFVGVPNTYIESNLIIASLIFLRYLTLGLFIRILFNKFSWR